MTLSGLQTAVLDALVMFQSLRGNPVPVIAEDAGNVVAERDSAFARTHLAVAVGSPSFESSSPDSATIEGTARLAVTVYEQPSRNRVGQRLAGPTALEEAEAIACEIHHLAFDGGVLVFRSIGGVERVDDRTIARTLNFDTIATLTGV